MNIYQHTVNDRTPYTYLVTHKVTGKRYYGSSYSKNCHPSKLGVSYFTSSKVIKEIIEKEGASAFTWAVRMICNSPNQARNREAKFLKQVKAAQSINWYNKSNGNKNFLCNGHNFETKKKIQKSSITRKCKPPQIHKVCSFCKLIFNTGSYALWHGPKCLQNNTSTAIQRTKDSNHTRKLKSDAKKSHKSKFCIYCNNWIDPANYGANHGDYCSANNTSTKKIKTKRPRTKCFYCNMEIANNVFVQWHGEKCKFKNSK